MGSSTLPYSLWELKEKAETKIALIDRKEGVSCTYRDLYLLAEKVAYFLKKEGYSENSRIGVYGGNSLYWAIVREGVLLLGGTFFSIPATLTLWEVERVISTLSPDFVFYDPSLPVPNSPSLPWDAIETFPSPPSSQEWKKGEEGIDILLTSGSSSRPRGVLRPRLRYGLRVKKTIDHFQLHPSSIHILPGPLSHSGPQLFYSVFRAMGGTQVIFSRFDPEETLKEIFLKKGGTLFMVPTMWRKVVSLLKEGEILPLERAITAGGPMDRNTRFSLLSHLPENTLYEFYGATETGTITILPPPLQKKFPHTVGFPVEGVKIRIREEEGWEPPCGKIYVETPTLMAGYTEGEPDFWEGGISVGDYGYLTPEGALVLVGRGDGTIVTGGINVHRFEVESLLREIPGVKEGIVFGVPDPEWGNRMVALLELSSPVPLSASYIRSYLKERLAPYKVPKEFRVVDTLPRTYSEKLRYIPGELQNLWEKGKPLSENLP